MIEYCRDITHGRRIDPFLQGLAFAGSFLEGGREPYRTMVRAGGPILLRRTQERLRAEGDQSAKIYWLSQAFYDIPFSLGFRWGQQPLVTPVEDELNRKSSNESKRIELTSYRGDVHVVYTTGGSGIWAEWKNLNVNQGYLDWSKGMGEMGRKVTFGERIAWAMNLADFAPEIDGWRIFK